MAVCVQLQWVLTNQTDNSNEELLNTCISADALVNTMFFKGESIGILTVMT